MKTLDNKVAIITGGSRGIGKEIVKKYCEDGAKVYFTYVSSEAKAKEFENEIINNGGFAEGIKSDASIFLDAENLINHVFKKENKIDILVNNAGITKDGLLMRMSEEDFLKVIQVNLNSIFNTTKAVQKVMLKQRSGSIINMSSVVGVNGNAGQSNYAASKAGIIGFSKSIAKELGSRNIRCNVIAPGFIETEMTGVLNEETLKQWLQNIPLKRPGKTEDVANLCVFLGSDKSSYITGQVITVCGGLSM